MDTSVLGDLRAGGARRAARRRARERWAASVLLLVLATMLSAAAVSQSVVEDVTARVMRMFPGADTVGAVEGEPPAAAVSAAGRLLGFAFVTDQVTPIPAYSGKPVAVLVGLGRDGVIRGAEVIRHEEPILVIGVGDDALSRFTAQYAGHRAEDEFRIGGDPRPGVVVLDGISGATITMMVLNASILQATKAVADSRGLPLAPDTPAAVARATARMAEAVAPALGASPARPAGNAHRPPAIDTGSDAIWRQAWEARTPRLWVLAGGLSVLTAILFLQDWLTRHRRLLASLRTGFLAYSVLFIGYFGLAQLSVVNVLTFVHSAIRDFRWETFLIEPLIFVLWCYVAISVLLWGRGVFCGWLCPFGALQELVNRGARRLGVRQLPLPALIHERLLAIKYVLLLGLFGLSLQSLPEAVRFAEVEPFKTTFVLRFDREWPFVAYALGLLVVSAFNGKLFCKYLCPLGAALTIPSHFRIFDWLRRRKECGRPCQTCAVECPSQAIRPTGEINANECHHCLDCQVTFWDPHKCPPLVEKRKRAEKHGRTLEHIPLR
ncbi:MAG: 4Fe-4S binding protein [Ectothiorhodospiraceae bacterium]|nr:4Fe-4S binding protein [Chromatiales bacterium]MCP5154120.1 4Fe-4S binding protein [Ectothiorhodospiraceae bacterium]